MAQARGLSPRSIAGQRSISEQVKSALPTRLLPTTNSSQITFQESTWLEFYLLGVPSGTSTRKGDVSSLQHPLVQGSISP